ncbi:histidine--tRNA ligase [Thermocladium modestius]|nr:histidine--tRNA ligase [Thermocladium modestius]
MDERTLHPPRGMNDWLPPQYDGLVSLMAKFSAAAESFGYRRIETPAVENFEVLKAKAGSDVVNEIYYFKDKAGRELGLRFDMTVPTARVVSYRQDLPKPIRFYYTTKVWRYDEPQQGRYREFHQYGVELIGSSTTASDAEVLALSLISLQQAGAVDATAKVSDRRVIDRLLDRNGVPSRSRPGVLRALDKRGKISDEEIMKLIMDEGLSREAAHNLVAAASIDVPLPEAGNAIREAGAGDDLVNYHESLFHALDSYGVGKQIRLNLGIVRGLDYYTGFVFELFLKDYGLSVGGGGRYDDLIKIYSGQDVPATGFAIGVERVFLAMNSQASGNPVDYYVYAMDPSLMDIGIKLANSLRSRGFKVILDLGDKSLRSALDYASRLGSLKFVLIGKREVQQGLVRVRDMSLWQEEDVPLSKFMH